MCINNNNPLTYLSIYLFDLITHSQYCPCHKSRNQLRTIETISSLLSFATKPSTEMTASLTKHWIVIICSLNFSIFSFDLHVKRDSGIDCLFPYCSLKTFLETPCACRQLYGADCFPIVYMIICVFFSVG